jgi:8-oxo-dGTP pyrophosphatase MutT (NUDIX family)
MEEQFKNDNIIHSYKSDDFHLEYFMNQYNDDSESSRFIALDVSEREQSARSAWIDEKNNEDINEEEDEYIPKSKYNPYINQKKIFCTNCGKYGHNYKKCIFPITSVGIICISFAPVYFNDMIYYIKKYQNIENIENNKEKECKIILSNEEQIKLNKIYENIKNIDENNYDKIIKYLMIQRKHTFSYVELIRGKYDLDNIDYVYNTIQYMTLDERKRVLNSTFEELWSDLWYHTNKDVNREKDMNIAKDKFELLKKGLFIKKNDIVHEYNLQKIIKNCKYKYNLPEWGFPKGRRNLKEKNIDCANREFQEETNLNHSDYHIINLSPLEELFMGINNIRYKNIYYIGQTCRKIELKIDKNNDSQNIEIGDIQWLNYNQSLDVIREYDIEKRNVIINNHIYLKNIFLLFQNILKNILQK